MKTPSWLLLSIPVVLAVLGGAAISAQDKYAVQVPGGLSLSACRGYEEWPAVVVSHPEDKINMIVANQVTRASPRWSRAQSPVSSWW
jgi:hypothetical protein